MPDPMMPSPSASQLAPFQRAMLEASSPDAESKVPATYSFDPLPSS
jgi:hypothetical protein